MADEKIRYTDLLTTASEAADDDYIAIDGTTNGTRKILVNNIGVDVDTTLSVSGAAADAATVGDELDAIKEDFLNSLITNTASGSIASFTDGAALPVKDLTVGIEPVQDTSSGDPSPSNVCPITGFSEVNVYVGEVSGTADTTTTISLGSTYYGGTLDVTTGVLTVTMANYTFTGSETWIASSTANRFSCDISSYIDIAEQAMTTNAEQNVYSSMFGQFIYKNADGVGYCYNTASSGVRLVINTTSADTVTEVAALFTDTQLVYELATPLTVQLTATEVETLLGDNNVWADSGDVSVEYYADTKLYISNLLGS